tara:strand:+ start:50 stop:493 length:444 start_codon:yes stop_codon:yes gene_type:complete
MNIATEEDFERVKEIFYQHKEWFPHIRTDYMMRMIEDKQLILDNDVIITFHHTKSKQTVGNIIVPKFSTILHQIANGTQGKGNAREVLNRFFEYCSGNVYLTVRQDNLTANKFYVNMGMILIGETMWANGTLPGYVYVRNKFNRLSI